MPKYLYKVVGVTFQDEQGHDRQDTLKRLFSQALADENEDYNVSLRGYTYNNAPAIAVDINGRNVGVIAADKVSDVLEIAQKAKSITATIEFCGYDASEYTDFIDMYRARKSMLKDEILDIFEVEDLERDYGRMKETPHYSCVLFFDVDNGSTGDIRGLEFIEETHIVPEDKKLTRAQKVIYIICLIIGVISVLLAITMFTIKSIGAGVFMLLVGAFLCSLSVSMLRNNKK